MQPRHHRSTVPPHYTTSTACTPRYAHASSDDMPLHPTGHEALTHCTVLAPLLIQLTTVKLEPVRCWYEPSDGQMKKHLEQHSTAQHSRVGRAAAGGGGHSIAAEPASQACCHCERPALHASPRMPSPCGLKCMAEPKLASAGGADAPGGGTVPCSAPWRKQGIRLMNRTRGVGAGSQLAAYAHPEPRTRIRTRTRTHTHTHTHTHTMFSPLFLRAHTHSRTSQSRKCRR